MDNDQGAKNNNFTETKKYFLKYFAKSMGDYFYKYIPSENEDDGEIIKVPDKSMNCIWRQISTVKYKIEGIEKLQTFCILLQGQLLNKIHKAIKHGNHETHDDREPSLTCGPWSARRAWRSSWGLQQHQSA